MKACKHDMPYLLTINQAAIYFGIGRKRLYKISKEYESVLDSFVVKNGNRTMIIRTKFEDFLNNTNVV